MFIFSPANLFLELKISFFGKNVKSEAQRSDLLTQFGPEVFEESVVVGSGENIGGQLEAFEGVEGDVPVVHHAKDHRHAGALERQQLDGSQVGHRAGETETTGRETLYIYILIYIYKYL